MLPLAVPSASETVKVADAANEPEVALTVVCPEAVLIATPLAFIVATAGAEELQTTLVVISSVVPLRYVPVAMNC